MVNGEHAAAPSDIAQEQIEMVALLLKENEPAYANFSEYAGIREKDIYKGLS